jgi:hypothetical protein
MTFHIFYVTFLELVGKLGPTIVLVIISLQLRKLISQRS